MYFSQNKPYRSNSRMLLLGKTFFGFDMPIGQYQRMGNITNIEKDTDTSNMCLVSLIRMLEDASSFTTFWILRNVDI